MPDWILPAVLTAFAAVIWFLARRMLAKLDSIESYMQSELRTMDVRLSVVETLVLPPKK